MKQKFGKRIERIERGRSKLAEIFEPFVIVTLDATNVNKVDIFWWKSRKIVFH